MRELVAATIGAIILIAWGVAAANDDDDQWAMQPDGAFQPADEISAFGASTVGAFDPNSGPNGGALDRDAGLAR